MAPGIILIKQGGLLARIFRHSGIDRADDSRKQCRGSPWRTLRAQGPLPVIRALTVCGARMRAPYGSGAAERTPTLDTRNTSDQPRGSPWRTFRAQGPPTVIRALGGAGRTCATPTGERGPATSSRRTLVKYAGLDIRRENTGYSSPCGDDLRNCSMPVRADDRLGGPATMPAESCAAPDGFPGV